MEKELKCPKCGCEKINITDIYDIEGAYIEGENALVERCIGLCRNCHTELQWDQVYKFSGFRDVESVE